MDGEISTDEVYDLLASDTDEEIRIVDIRDEHSFERGRIPGSENVPFDELPTSVDTVAGADRIVTVCPHGNSSVQAARLIASYEGTADARVESMAGGLTEWAERYELEGDANADADADDLDAPF